MRTVESPATRPLHELTDELCEALDHAEQITQVSLGGHVEYPTLASRADRIASAIAEIEFEVPDTFCERIDLDLTATRSDFRRLASDLNAAAKGDVR